MMDTSGQRVLQDTTTMNKGPINWLGHVMRWSTGASSVVDACQLHTCTHCMSTESYSMP